MIWSKQEMTANNEMIFIGNFEQIAIFIYQPLSYRVSFRSHHVTQQRGGRPEKPLSHILLQYYADITQPIKFKERHILNICLSANYVVYAEFEDVRVFLHVL